jgi:hypothetical protein
MAKMLDSDRQILCSVIITAHHMGHMIHLHDAMNGVDESNILQGGHGNTLGNTGPGTAATFAPGPMESGSFSQLNSCPPCGGRGHWTYFCTTPKDWKKGDPIKKPDFDKA